MTNCVPGRKPKIRIFQKSVNGLLPNLLGDFAPHPNSARICTRYGDFKSVVRGRLNAHTNKCLSIDHRGKGSEGEEEARIYERAMTATVWSHENKMVLLWNTTRKTKQKNQLNTWNFISDFWWMHASLWCQWLRRYRRTISNVIFLRFLSFLDLRVAVIHLALPANCGDI